MPSDSDPKKPTNGAPNSPEEEADESNDAASSSLTDAIAELTRQRDDTLDQLRRTQAEFLNYQKRAKQQAETDRQYAITGLVLDLLSVLDNFERALTAAKTSGVEAIVSGLEMVEKQLLAALQKHGVEVIPALHHPFDPNLHEAIVQQPKPNVPEGTVIAELGKGYKLKDRVLRPSKVAVSIRPQE
jgi:molecular chaperone GrpE